MKIAIFSETYLPDTNGVATHIKTLSDGLVLLGHDVLIVCADFTSKRHKISDGVMHCPSVRTGKKLYKYSLSSPFSIKRLLMIKKWKPDVIHIQNEFGIGLSGLIIAKCLRIPLIYTIHTMYGDYLGYISYDFFLPTMGKLSRKYLSYISKRADAVTGASKKVAEYLHSCGADKEIILIPNTAETEMFSNIQSNDAVMLKRSLSIPKDALTLCFCGRLGKEKSVDLLIKLWAHCSRITDDIYLVIIGDGPEYQGLVSLAEKAGIYDYVRFVGKIPHSSVAPYYAMCDAFITASVTENHSVSMLEALSAGLPIVHISDEKNDNQLSEGVNGFTFTGAEELAAVLVKLRNMSESERNKLRYVARKSVECYGKRELAEKTAQVYKKACEEYEKTDTPS